MQRPDNHVDRRITLERKGIGRGGEEIDHQDRAEKRAHGDERINEAAKVLTGDLVPGQHCYPPPIHYLNALGLAGLFALGLPLEWRGGPGAFRAQYYSDPTVFYVTAWLLAALIGALLAPLFYAIARCAGLEGWRGLWVGVLGALFPLGVFMAHIAKGDTALATCTVAVI